METLLVSERAPCINPDVFLHISALERAGLTTVSDDQKVTFDAEPGRDNRNARSHL